MATRSSLAIAAGWASKRTVASPRGARAVRQRAIPRPTGRCAGSSRSPLNADGSSTCDRYKLMAAMIAGHCQSLTSGRTARVPAYQLRSGSVAWSCFGQHSSRNTPLSSDPGAIAVGDFDADGHDDIAVGQDSYPVDGRLRAGRVQLWRGAGVAVGFVEPVFQTLTSTVADTPGSSGGFGANLVAAPFDDDGSSTCDRRAGHAVLGHAGRGWCIGSERTSEDCPCARVLRQDSRNCRLCVNSARAREPRLSTARLPRPRRSTPSTTCRSCRRRCRCGISRGFATCSRWIRRADDW